MRCDDAREVRIGLGCMRLSTDAERDEARGIATIRAALDAGITLFDTAHAYGHDDADAGHNERLLARAIVASGTSGSDRARVRIVTKCGMRRPEGAWVPDGRAGAIADDVAASRDALGGLGIDLLLLHAPDPRTAFATSVRALLRAKEDGLVRGIGLSNVSLTQLRQALDIAPIAAVEVALGAFDDASVRGGIVRYCGENGIEVIAHSVLGGPKRAARLARDRELTSLARLHARTPAELVLAYLLQVHQSIVPLLGARRPESVSGAVRASGLAFDEPQLLALDARFPALGALRRPPRTPVDSRREVVLIMGIPGAGKSRAAAAHVARGYLRLNRDSIGGTLKNVGRLLEEALSAGAERVVLDNTYVTRASRSEVVLAAHRHGAHVRCVFHDTPMHEAQLNVVLRMLARHGALIGPERMAALAKTDPGLVRPTVLFRMLRELEPPSLDEGFAAVEVVPFERERAHASSTEAPRSRGVMIALDCIAHDVEGELVARANATTIIGDALGAEGAPCLLVAFRPEANAVWQERAAAIAAALAVQCGRAVELAVCAHAAGPPVCWCRPPLPGLWLAFAHRHALDPHRGLVIGNSAAYGTMARSLGLESRTPNESSPRT